MDPGQSQVIVILSVSLTTMIPQEIGKQSGKTRKGRWVRQPTPALKPYAVAPAIYLTVYPLPSKQATCARSNSTWLPALETP
jgi:hypothetical protein